MEQISPNQFITLSLGITDCFLLPYGNDYLLIDTSTEKYYSKFKKELSKHCIALSQIKYIFLTHHHTDHTGFLRALLEETKATLIVHKNALPFLAKGINNNEMMGTTGFIRLYMRFQTFFRLARTNKEVIPDDNSIIIDSDNNEMLRNLGIPAEIITLPGHTADSIALIFDNGNAFIGDAATNLPRMLNLNYQPLVAEDIVQIKTSWIKLKNKHAKELFVSHGKSFLIDLLFKNLSD